MLVAAGVLAGVTGISTSASQSAGAEPASTESSPYSCDAEAYIYQIRPFDLHSHQEWCASAHSGGIDSDQGGRPLRVTLCRDLASGDATLHFPRRQEADFVIVDSNGREVWRWSRTRRDVDPAHTRLIPAGTCVEWKISWQDRDQEGEELPGAKYYLRATVLADEFNGQWWEHAQAILVGGMDPDGDGEP